MQIGVHMKDIAEKIKESVEKNKEEYIQFLRKQL